MNKFSPKKLRSFREHQKLTQELLAELCGVDTTTISGWEKGKWEPSLQSALALAAALNVSVEDLCDIDTEIDYSKPIMQKITKLLNALTTDELSLVLDTLARVIGLYHTND